MASPKGRPPLKGRGATAPQASSPRRQNHTATTPVSTTPHPTPDNTTNNNLQVKVQILATKAVGDDEWHSFTLSGAQILQREKSMRRIFGSLAKESSGTNSPTTTPGPTTEVIPQWKGSTLYNCFKHYLLQQQQQQHPSQQQQQPNRSNSNNNAITLQLNPELYCQEQNLGHLQWTQELTYMMKHYYTSERTMYASTKSGAKTSGQAPSSTTFYPLVIAPTATGQDVLLACEYFGVLYEPHQLQFVVDKDATSLSLSNIPKTLSFDVCTSMSHENLCEWSEYLSLRSDLGDFVAHSVVQCVQQEQEPHASSSSQKHPTRLVEFVCTTGDVIPLDASSVANDVTPAGTSYKIKTLVLASPNWSGATCVRFFGSQFSSSINAGSHIHRRQALMRRDFAFYLQNLLTHVRVTFTDKCVLRIETHPQGSLSSQQQQQQQQQQRTAPTTPASPSHNSRASSKKALPYPIDELVQEDLREGRLEKLIQSVHERQARLSNQKKQQQQNAHSTPAQPTSMSFSDHVYQDLLQAPTTPTRTVEDDDYAADNELENIVVQRVVGVGGSLEEKDDTCNDQELPASGAQLPKYQRPNDITHQQRQATATITTMDNSTISLPVRVIRAPSSGNQSVTSALTGPYGLDDSDGMGSLVSVRDPYEQAALALRHEFIQGSLLNRGISTRIKELLEEPADIVEEEDNILEETQPKPAAAGTNANGNGWEWIDTICAYPKELLTQQQQRSLQPLSAGQEANNANATSAFETVGARASDIIRTVEKNTELFFKNKGRLWNEVANAPNTTEGEASESGASKDSDNHIHPAIISPVSSPTRQQVNSPGRASAVSVSSTGASKSPSLVKDIMEKLQNQSTASPGDHERRHDATLTAAGSISLRSRATTDQRLMTSGRQGVTLVLGTVSEKRSAHAGKHQGEDTSASSSELSATGGGRGDNSGDVAKMDPKKRASVVKKLFRRRKQAAEA